MGAGSGPNRCQGHDREHIQCSPCSAHLSIAHRRLQSPLRFPPRDVLLRSCIHHPGSPNPLPRSVAFTHNLHGAHLTRAVLPALNTLATAPSPPLPLRSLHSHHPQPLPPPAYALSHTTSRAFTPAIPLPLAWPCALAYHLLSRCLHLCPLPPAGRLALGCLRSPTPHLACDLRTSPAHLLIMPRSVASAPLV